MCEQVGAGGETCRGRVVWQTVRVTDIKGEESRMMLSGAEKLIRQREGHVNDELLLCRMDQHHW